MCKKVFAYLLTFSMLFWSVNIVPITAFANNDNAGVTTGCVHVHDETCGYTEDSPCNHICGEDCADGGDPAAPETSSESEEQAGADAVTEEESSAGSEEVAETGEPKFSPMMMQLFFEKNLSETDLTVEIKDSQTVGEIRFAIQEQINLVNSKGGGTVTVTGTRTVDADSMLTLEIPEKVTVLWKAAYPGSTPSYNYLIKLTGDGSFEVGAGGAITQAGSASALYWYSDNGKIIV
ncbi:MAG TPA: hypothetical protein GX726_02090, partial [Clostridiales bacterium]|nr:hypothetical protein [Clostridiales bacterium]